MARRPAGWLGRAVLLRRRGLHRSARRHHGGWERSIPPQVGPSRLRPHRHWFSAGRSMAFGEGLGLSKIHVHVHVFIYPDFSLLGIRAIFVRLYYSYSFHARSFSLVKAYGGSSALGPCSLRSVRSRHKSITKIRYSRQPITQKSYDIIRRRRLPRL